MGIKDEDLEGLSDEERAALAEDDDEADILKNIAGDDGDDANDDGEEGDGEADDPAAGADDADPAGDGDADAAGAADEANAGADDDKAAKGDEPGEVAAEFQPQFNTSAPEGLTEKLTELDTQTQALLAKFKDGEIELPDFMAQKEAIDNERLQLKLAASQAQWAADQNESSRAQRWQWEQERFFGQEKAAVYNKDPIAMAALNEAVKRVSADQANAKKPLAFYLEEADRQVRKLFNFGGEQAKPNDQAKNRQPDLSKVPKTLANLPAADLSETGADEFAYLEKLDGIALEQALRKLTPEQEARYLGAAA